MVALKHGDLLHFTLNMSLPSHDSIEQMLTKAEQLKFDGKYAEALALLEELLVMDPDNVTALEELADNELSLGRYERAKLAALHALRLDHDSYTAHYILGFIASHAEDWPTSITELKIANSLEQNNPEILRCLGWSLFSSGKKIEGMVTLERALNLEEQNPLILCDLGVACLRSNEFGKSKALLSRALDIDPANSRVKECLEMVRRIEKHVA
ncbi:tetratricopeptide repeat protein [Candidatus Peribacteria bacterium]|nr:tetratricopeptide repeat protein [Candidatus Peribacteria bacterium]